MTTTHTVIEYGIAERVDGELRNLPQCGSWYTDRYYTNDLTGRDAAQAAIARIAEQAEGTYEIVELRSFQRAADAGLADALTDEQLREWFALRGNPTGDYLDELLAEARGKTADQLDAWYASLHSDMA